MSRTEMLHAFDNYIIEREKRKSFRIHDDIDVTEFEVLSSAHSLITLTHLRSKLVVGTENGYLGVIRISDLNSSLILDNHLHNESERNIWHAVIQQNGENVIYSSTKIFSQSMDKTRKSIISNSECATEFGRKGLYCLDNRFVLAGCGSSVLMYDLSTLVTVSSLILPSYRNLIRCIELLPGRRLASGGDLGGIRIWDLEAEREVANLEVPRSIWCMLYMHSDLLVIGAGGVVECWNIETHKRVATISPKFTIRTLTYLSLEMFLVTCDDGVMFALNLYTFEKVLEFPMLRTTSSLRTDILGVEILDDGRLVTCSRDKKLRIWRVASPKGSEQYFKRLRACTSYFDVNVLC